MNPTSDQFSALIFTGIAFLFLLVTWITLCIALRKTTAEFRLWLDPSNLIKILTIFVIVISTTALAILKIIDGNLVSTLFGGIVGYTLGTGLKQQKNQNDSN